MPIELVSKYVNHGIPRIIKSIFYGCDFLNMSYSYSSVIHNLYKIYIFLILMLVLIVESELQQCEGEKWPEVRKQEREEVREPTI